MAGELLTVDDALRLIEQHAAPLSPARAPLDQSLGLRLAADAVSDVDSPPHDKAMMDGYAVVADEPQRELRVIDEVLAGGVPTNTVSLGEATRIMTGAPVPVGAAAVVPVELTELINESTVRLTRPAPPAGKHVMRRGEVFARGESILPAGALITAAQLAVLAEIGVATPSVTPAPTVAVLATGDELVEAHEVPAAGQIRNSNGPMLHALVTQAAARLVPLGVARDNADSLTERITAGGAADVLVLSGGVSAGKRDLAPGVLAGLGVEQVFHKVAVKPGKPLWFGVWRRPSGRQTLVFGLPGNPVSGFVCFQLFVRPLLSRLAGGPFGGLPCVDAELAEQVTVKGDRRTFLPAQAAYENGRWAARPVAWRGSADLKGLAAANALLDLPAQEPAYAAGQRVGALLLEPVVGR
ncbi:Molybdopterin molybdenumtransferase [Posidoniimonas corsicana]|uniref:Molybdopterin molybdenumtransferase n=1 Tax=Posidoniimonas corsicana TaxID=1938618 RepID=A0A5C5V101_9BACT|nr:gephyrin-like molybdotransferase Glp [Posidoniimonas corsicana]TWT32304.1 Molybdopterin molybdenumtransferase [Posidoniimonas corsicana]